MEHIKQATAIICLSPYSGGMELDAIKLAKKLSSQMQITVIAQSECFIASKQDEYVGHNNISLESISFNRSFSPNIITTVRKIIQNKKIKNVIFFGASELKSLYFSFLGQDINLIIRHGTTKSRPKKDWFHKLIYSDVNYHISICKHLEENVNFIIPFGKNTQSKLIYSSFEFTEPKTLSHPKLTLLHVGRIADAKGQVDAIKACKVLVENDIDFEFNLVGGFDEAYKEEFLSFYTNCPYKDKINLVGFTDDVKSYIQKADIFLFPSYGEGLSNAFIEALSNNIICISYNNTSFPELKLLGIYFRISQNKNISELQKLLLQVVHDLDLEKKRSKINNTLIETFFSINKEINLYLDILR